MLNADGLQTYLGAVAASGIASGFPVFLAISYLAKQASNTTVNVSLDLLAKMTGYSRSELNAAIKALRLGGHRVDWNSKDECIITIDSSKGMKLLGPWMVEQEIEAITEEESVQLNPPLDRLNELMGTSYSMSAEIAAMLRSRIKIDKMTIDQLVHVVEVKYEQWHGDPKMHNYLRPRTLFDTKAVEYAQEKKRSKITDEKLVSREDLSRMFAG